MFPEYEFFVVERFPDGRIQFAHNRDYVSYTDPVSGIDLALVQKGITISWTEYGICLCGDNGWNERQSPIEQRELMLIMKELIDAADEIMFASIDPESLGQEGRSDYRQSRRRLAEFAEKKEQAALNTEQAQEHPVWSRVEGSIPSEETT